jgi:hypothetical protein
LRSAVVSSSPGRVFRENAPELPNIRNRFAHPEMHTIMPPGMSVDALILVPLLGVIQGGKESIDDTKRTRECFRGELEG